jgi:hypothetical protein
MSTFTLSDSMNAMWSVRPKSTSHPRDLTPAYRMSTTPCTTRLSWLHTTAASDWETKRSISARFLPDWPSGSKKCRMISGWSALWIMIWDTSIWRPECLNRSKIRSAQNCHLCDRYDLLPMSPGQTLFAMVGAEGFEPPTLCSQSRSNGLLKLVEISHF